MSPPLAISGVPGNARSLALMLDDPDAPAGAWVHWLVASMPPETAKLSPSHPPEGAVEGRNSWGAAHYDGPQPPAGIHRYVFHLYALDVLPALKPGFSRAELEAAAKSHILAQTELVGTFGR